MNHRKAVTPPERMARAMYETIKVVNGFEIYRMKGTHGFYYVNIREGKGWKEFHTFHTIKAAVQFCETVTK